MRQSSPRSPASAQQQQQQPATASPTSTSSRPYETRRVSLSLPALGISLPGRHNSHNNHSNSSNHRASQSSGGSPSGSAPDAQQHGSSASAAAANSPAPKRVKRSHTTAAPPSNNNNSSTNSTMTLSSRPRNSSNAAEKSPSKKSQQQRQQQQQRAPTRLTPPPSPRDDGGALFGDARVDIEGINDDIVVGVIQLLESTGNRPHLIKEFAAILRNSLSSVESSANPTAIISSRLTNYLKRPWTALAPCPLTKEQVTTHPRRVYYYLTTIPRQPIPEYVEPLAAPVDRVSPAVSTDQDEAMSPMDDIAYGGSRLRNALSPSPEVEFSSAEFTFSTGPSVLGSSFDDEDPRGFGAFTDDAFNDMEPSEALIRNVRAVSPPLEHDEREFTATASSLQMRRATEQAEQQQLASAAASAASPGSDHSISAGSSPSADTGVEEELPDACGVEEESEENVALANRQCAAELFAGSSHYLLSAMHGADVGSSPMLRPTNMPAGGMKSAESMMLSHTMPKKTVRIFEGELMIPGQDTPVSSDVHMFDAGNSKAWDELRSPENIELHELDDMFSNY